MIQLSVVIPTYNRAKRLRSCLDALARQTQPAQDFEVIVVNDGGTDTTEKMVADLNAPYALKYLHQKNQGQNVARNYGVEFAQGRYCLFLDDDIIAEPELIAEHLKLHQQHVGVIGLGQMSLHFETTTNWFITSYLSGWHKHYEELNQGARQPTWEDCYAGNLSIGRSVFLEVGGFVADIRKSHDVELGYRLQQFGLQYVYLARALGRQEERKEVGELLADVEKAGAAWVTLCQRHPGMYPHLLGSMIPGLREALLLNFFWMTGMSPGILAGIGFIFANTRWDRQWFRFVNHYCRWRGYRRAASMHTSSKALIPGTPILMYHAFGKPGEQASRFVLPIRRFIQQMNLLKWLGYRVLSLENFQQYFINGSLPPEGSVILTVDDGYADFYDLVYPTLRRHGFTATVFIVSEKAGTCNDWTSLHELSGRPLLTWDEIREMGQYGIQYGAHSRTHARLLALASDRMHGEIAGAKADLENVLDTPITAFAYPYGEYNIEAQDALLNAGFRAGFSANSGLNILGSPSFAFHRIEVEGTISLLRFVLALWLGNTR
jgi:glycosyltransferase involved in cell wall biosynthesis